MKISLLKYIVIIYIEPKITVKKKYINISINYFYLLHCFMAIFKQFKLKPF